MIRYVWAVLGVAALLSSCDATPQSGQASNRNPLPARATQPHYAPAIADGPATAIAPEPGPSSEAATVAQVVNLPNLGRVFSLDRGPDGRMPTFLALPDGAKSWRLYRLGAFDHWDVTEAGRGRFTLVVGPDAGLAALRARPQSDRLIVSFTVVDGPQPPSVTITPAH